MGVKALSQQEVMEENPDVATGCGRILDKQNSRRMEKSILDDIMGDPDDFKDLADPDDDGGRWEDTVREALDTQETTGQITETSKHESMQSRDDRSGPEPLRSGGSSESCHGRRHKDEGRKLGKPSNSNINNGSRTYKSRKRFHTRYFVIKSLNHRNLSKSIEKGIWATQAMNEAVLNEAYEESEKVVLVFSVNMSGHFQGYARMTSPVGIKKTSSSVWNEVNDGSNPWGGTFTIEWLRLYDLPFPKTSHLKNPLNDYKPVKISRDCQELPQDIGEALCALIDEGADGESNQKRKSTSAEAAAVRSKRARDELPPLLTKPPPPPQQSKSSTDSWRNHDKEKERDKYRPKEKTKPNLPEEEEDLLNMTYEEYLQRHASVCGFQSYQQPILAPIPVPGNVPSSLPVPAASGFGGAWNGMGCYAEDQYTNYIANWYGGGNSGGEAFYGIPTTPSSAYHPHDSHWRPPH